VFNAFSAAVITLLQFLVAPQQAVQFLRWLIGAIRYEQSGTLVVGAVFMLAAVGALVVLSASAATGAAVAFSGMVGL
jgi:ABC-type Fe3+-siderophore transport system permease subunit